jgi:hypothetical protein
MELHRDAAGPGIDGVLHEFLDHGSRALNHLTSSHLTGEDIWEKAYGTHGGKG